MKKYYKIILIPSFLYCLCCLFTACDNINIPGENVTGKYYVDWKVHNVSNNNIILEIEARNYYYFTLEPNEIKLLDRASESDENHINFYRLINGSTNSFAKLFIEGENEPIRIWRKTDKDQPGKQFFNENSWIKEVKNDGYHIVWTFVIESQDI